MNQKNDIIVTLLECNNYLKRRFPNLKGVDLDLYEYNFKSLYSDVNDISLNEADQSLSRIFESNKNNISTYLDNPLVYVGKVMSYIDKANTINREDIISLNESLDVTTRNLNMVSSKVSNMDNYKKPNMDISKAPTPETAALEDVDIIPFQTNKTNNIQTYYNNLKRISNKLKLQNDLIHIDKPLLKVRQQLNKDVNVKGFDVNSKANRQIIESDTKTSIFAVLYDISKDYNIFLTKDGDTVRIFGIYDTMTDTFHVNNFNELYQDGEYQDYINYFKPEYNKPTNYIKYLRNCFGQSIYTVYTNIEQLGLKFTDNLYSDQAQKSLEMDNIKKKELFKNVQETY